MCIGPHHLKSVWNASLLLWQCSLILTCRPTLFERDTLKCFQTFQSVDRFKGPITRRTRAKTITNNPPRILHSTPAFLPRQGRACVCSGWRESYLKEYQSHTTTIMTTTIYQWFSGTPGPRGPTGPQGPPGPPKGLILESPLVIVFGIVFGVNGLVKGINTWELEKVFQSEMRLL